MTAGQASIIPAELGEFPALRGYDDAGVLAALAGRFIQREVGAGSVVAQSGTPVDAVFVVAHGRLARQSGSLQDHLREFGATAQKPRNRGEAALALTSGHDEKAVIPYLVSAYFSAAVLVPDAIGMPEIAELGR